MGAPWHDLESKLEAALLAVVNTLSLPVGANEGALVKNTGLDDDVFGLPSVICSVPEIGDEIVKDSGIHRATAEVRVNTQVDDSSLASHRARVATVRDGFKQDNIATTLSANADLHVYDVFFRGMRRDLTEREDGSKVFMNTLQMEIICCANDI